MSSFIRIDEIHQQLEEQLSVLAHFIDGVANLRPKGLYHWFFTFYKGRPVGSRFRQMGSKIQDWYISFRNCVYYSYKSVSFTTKRPRRPKTGVKMALKKWNANLRLGYSVRKKQDYLFRYSVAPGNFPLERPCSMFHLLSNRISRKRFVNGKQPMFQLIIPLQSSARLPLSFSHPSLSYPTQATLPFYFSSSPAALCRKYFYSGTKVFSRERTRGLFFESPGNFSGQESCSLLCLRSRSKLQ